MIEEKKKSVGAAEQARQNQLRSMIRGSKDPWSDFTKTTRNAVIGLYARLASIPDLASLADQEFESALRDFRSLVGEERVFMLVDGWASIESVIDSVGDLLTDMEKENAKSMRFEGKPCYPRVLDDAFFQNIDWPTRHLESNGLLNAWGNGQLLVRGRWDVLSHAWVKAEHSVAAEWLDPKWRDERWDRAEETMLLFLLGGVWADAREIVWRLTGGEKVILPGHLEDRRVYRLEGRVVVNVADDAGAPLFRPTLLEMLRERPFPFRRCPVCESVFVLERRGKPRRFCSTRCKAKGIPSAASRAEYAKDYRRRRRAEEIKITERVMAAWPKAERYAQLGKQFPGKSRRQLRCLIKCADQGSAPTGAKSEGAAE